MYKPHSPPVPDEIRIPVSEFVEIHGSTGAARLLGVSETALLRIVATGRSPLGTQARLRLILAKRARDALAAAGFGRENCQGAGSDSCR